MDEELKNEINEELNDAADTVENEVAAEEEQPQAELETETEAEEESVGNIKISVDVVSTIAGIATTELEGVAGMYSSFAGGIVEKLGAKKNPSKGVKVEMTESTVAIDLYIVVEYGVRIPELAWEIQENVKNNVETMTGLSVEKVNIHIEGVSFAKETAELASVETELLPEAEE
jgi:uncharacterized alkaline shock family protein YloU